MLSARRLKSGQRPGGAWAALLGRFYVYPRKPRQRLLYVYASLSRLDLQGFFENAILVFLGITDFSPSKKPTSLMMHWWQGCHGGVCDVREEPGPVYSCGRRQWGRKVSLAHATGPLANTSLYVVTRGAVTLLIERRNFCTFSGAECHVTQWSGVYFAPSCTQTPSPGGCLEIVRGQLCRKCTVGVLSREGLTR